MGSVSRVFKKVKRAVTKPISKAFKGVVKGIMKVGKATMRGVAKLNQKLGPLGSIAMAIAMPYALSGLSTATTAAMNSTNTFLKSIGTVGNSIRTGYQAFNAGVSKTFSTITKSISKGFQRFAPQGVKNMFSNISTGAKNLYNSAKATVKKYMPKPFEGKQGMSEVFGTGYSTDGPMLMSNTDLASKMTLPITDPNYISAGQVNMKSLTESGGWFTKTNAAGVQADTIVSDVINDAYKTRLDGFGTNAKRMFTDIKNKALEMDTYINDEQIGSFVENNRAASSYRVDTIDGPPNINKFQIKTEIPDLAETGDYTYGIARDSKTLNFTGGETFGKQPATQNFFQKNKKKLTDLTKSLLRPSGTAPIESAALPLSLDTTPIDMAQSTYGGTDIEGSKGGSLVAKVYGQRAADLLQYTANMNALNSGEKFNTA